MREKAARARKRHSVAIAIALLLCAFLLYGLSQTETVQKRYLYPFPYQQMIEGYAKANGVDSALVASVIMNESRFKPDAKSDTGALGLMQIMPSTAEWIAQQMGEREFDRAKLLEPETNIRFGTWYLAELHHEFSGNDVLMLAAYNAGRGNVHDWMAQNNWTAAFHSINAIPFAETRTYVLNVFKYWEKYSKLYKN